MQISTRRSGAPRLAALILAISGIVYAQKAITEPKFGGYTVGAKRFDALIFGYYEGDRLVYVARTRNGFTPALRDQLFKRFGGLEIAELSVRESARGQKRTLG